MSTTSTSAKPAESQAAAAHVALCMMVKDEALIIERALRSAIPWVDHWLVVDTGSSDATRDIVVHTMAGLPGRLVQHDWIDFATNRTAALRAARELGTEYILLMDADQTLEVSNPACWQGLTADAYNIQIKHGSLSYPHPWLLRASFDWRWTGLTHEYLQCDDPFEAATLSGAQLTEHADSHRRTTGAKLTEDMALLKAAYQEDPTDARTVFYLAQCCQDLGQYPCAIARYKERVALGGWFEEVWAAQYRIGRIHELQRDWPLAVVAYLSAYSMDCARAEPLYRLGRGELAQKRLYSAHLFLAEASNLAKPSGRLFLEEDVYDFAALWGLAMTLRLTGQHLQAETLENAIMQAEATPARVIAEIISSRTSKSIGSLPG